MTVRYVVHEPGVGYIRETTVPTAWLVNTLDEATLFTERSQAEQIVNRLKIERPHYEVLPVYVEISFMRFTSAPVEGLSDAN